MSKCCTFHQKKSSFVCENIPGNKTVSDSDSEIVGYALRGFHTNIKIIIKKGETSRSFDAVIVVRFYLNHKQTLETCQRFYSMFKQWTSWLKIQNTTRVIPLLHLAPTIGKHSAIITAERPLCIVGIKPQSVSLCSGCKGIIKQAATTPQRDEQASSAGLL